jgi:phosphoribosylamine--glycine ligase
MVSMKAQQNVLIIGGGGREHALAWKIHQSPTLGQLYLAPGNAGTALLGENVSISVTNVTALVAFAKEHQVGLTVVGPDDALAAGIVDAFQAAGLRIFGPTHAAAQVEASKSFAKDLMMAREIPTARYETFTNLENAKAYASKQKFPLVVKASGLALGKGVYIAADLKEAEHALDDIMRHKIFGESGSSVVIEEFLTGPEVSIHAFCDGHRAVLFPPAQDHKRIGTGDTGPNTGGMGTYAPVPWVHDGFMSEVRVQVLRPILAGLKAHGSPFTGVLYPGLLLTKKGIKVLEFNARFGDPETQTYMRLLQTDLLEILNACATASLSDVDIKWGYRSAITIVVASGGYPGKYQTGLPITGIEDAESDEDVVVFHAGTKMQSGQLVTNGGRVLGVTATARNLREAQKKAYAAVKKIHFEGMQYRTDIADKALARD